MLEIEYYQRPFRPFIYPGTTSTIDAAKVYTGEFLMKVGFNPNVKDGRNSVVLEVKVQ